MVSEVTVYAEQLGGKHLFWVDYLDNTIHYKLDKRDMEGLNRFRKLLKQQDA